METSTSEKVRSQPLSWTRVAKWLLVLLLLWILVQQLAQTLSVVGWAAFGPSVRNGSGLLFLGAAMLLMPLNWGLEATKWRYLLVSLGVQLSWKQLCRAVLAGISVSVVTPNRMGEYAGRVLLVRAEERWPVALSTLAGSWCQWMGFLLIGWPSLCAWLGRYYTHLGGWVWPLALVGPVAAVALSWSWDYWRSQPLPAWVKYLPLRASWKTFLAPMRNLKEISGRELRKASVLASMRFVVYCVQYWLVLHFLGLNLSLGWGLAGIAAIYLVQAGLPLPPGVGLLTRAEMALLLWGDTAEAQAAILSGTLLIFVINLGLPSLLGMWFIVKKS